MSEKFKRGSIVTNKNGDEFDCKVVILVTGDRSTSDHHFSGVCIHTYNKKIHPVGDFSTTWHLNKFVKLHDSLEEWLSDESPAEQPGREVEFVEWITDHYDVYNYGLWRHNKLIIDDTVYTTAQLYQLFKEQKKA